MGYTVHHSIVVVSWNLALLSEVHDYAASTGASVSPIIPGLTNGIASFLVASDGSKEGWTDSDIGDSRRNSIKHFIRSKANADGSTSLDWFEASHPEDQPPKVVDHQKRRAK